MILKSGQKEIAVLSASFFDNTIIDWRMKLP